MMPKAKFNELSSVIDSIKMVSSTEFLVNDRGTYLTADGHGQKLRIDRSKTNIYPFVELHEILYSILHTKQKFLYYHTEKFDHYSDTQKLTESLSEANTGEGTWDPGWEITNIEENGQELAVQRDGLTLWVFPNEIFVEENESSVGKNCYIKIGKEFRDLLPGFYMAIGNATNNYNLENVVRIYWNITTEGAIKLTKNLTTELNLMNIPFRFKILKDPYAFSRVDAAVLYINKEYLTGSVYKDAEPELRRLRSLIRNDHLIHYERGEVPLKQILSYLKLLDRESFVRLADTFSKEIVSEFNRIIDAEDDKADLRSNGVISLSDLAARYNVPIETVRLALQRREPGNLNSTDSNKDGLRNYLIVGPYLIRKDKIVDLQASLLKVNTLSEANLVIDKLRIPIFYHIDLLSELGYDVIWRGLDANNASIKPHHDKLVNFP